MNDIKQWLTIVIPAYNGEQFLEACVASIDPLSNGDVQIVLVDDGSTDATPTICDSLAHEHQNVTVVHKSNGGLPSARNAGLTRVSSEWTWFVDSDDLIAPKALLTLRSVLATTDSNLVKISFTRFSDAKPPEWSDVQPLKEPIRLTADELVQGLYNGEYEHYLWSAIFRTATLHAWNDSENPGRNAPIDAGPFREEFSLYEDVVSTHEILRHVTTIDHIDKPLYAYRQISTSMTHRRNDEAARSGLAAVRNLQRYTVNSLNKQGKLRMEMGLLFSCYRLVENGTDSGPLKQSIRDEITARAAALRPTNLDYNLLIRYVLMRTGLMDLIISWQSRG